MYCYSVLKVQTWNHVGRRRTNHGYIDRQDAAEEGLSAELKPYQSSQWIYLQGGWYFLQNYVGFIVQAIKQDQADTPWLSAGPALPSAWRTSYISLSVERRSGRIASVSILSDLFTVMPHFLAQMFMTNQSGEEVVVIKCAPQQKWMK